jgi:hypothetical protein
MERWGNYGGTFATHKMLLRNISMRLIIGKQKTADFNHYELWRKAMNSEL